MKPNVHILVRERGKIMARRQGHNTWTPYGAEYLAGLASLASYGPDVPQRDARLRYIGFGIGGAGQNQRTMADSAPWSTVFPAGLDPNATTGYEYRSAVPTSPPIGTLERPVPITAVTGPTPAYPAALDWRTSAFDATQVRNPLGHPAVGNLTSTSFFAQFQQGVGGHNYYIHNPMVPGGFMQMPLSEAGLFLNDVTTTVAYEPVVAYITFDTVQITQYTDLEIEWEIRF